ncbi:enoyl-CoA hydratase [Croceicoccus estronivorus]|uniref:enoyl-CoA hydratase/isomerase family protein n=1 Tax=Croceicoccus estronivorus TaxID=1172626 RepID=UPI00082F0B2F|nr:enoyl-CoA hydratase/isomerase family protein [Croceicoccus estronivorus]OCC23507.1 enoyl-CoA hydratase [Croceicoccus estronivorus]
MSNDSEAELLMEWMEGDVVLLTMNCPRARNTVSFEMWEQFSAALDTIENGTPPRAVVLCGAEGHFSNGGDVKKGPARGEGALALAKRLEMGQRIIARLRALPCPTIAAIEGGAHGIAWSLALACDMVLCAREVKFSAPFISFGLVPDGGSSWFLGQHLGRQRAAELFFSGRTMDASEAFDLGLVSRLVDPGNAIAEAIAFGRSIENRHAAELTKRLLHLSESADLAACHALELVYCHSAQGGDEVKRAREAVFARAAAKKAAKS